MMYTRKHRPPYKPIFIEDYAYTPDLILVHNIFICCFPEEVTNMHISDHFGQFGQLRDVRFKGKGAERKCFVYYVNAKDASIALQTKPHFLMQSVIHVEPCLSENQPDGRKILEQLDSYLRCDSTTDSCSSSDIIQQDALIFTLNDDCLEHICKKMSITDQINFALTCPRFYSVIVMLSKVEYASFNTDVITTMSPWKTKLFLQIVGPQIKYLDTSCTVIGKSLFVHLGTFCRNVEKLRASFFRDSGLLRKLVAKMERLRELELPNCEFNEKFIKFLRIFKSLKSLSFDNNGRLTGKYIHFFTGLEKLSLRHCTQLIHKYLKKIFRNLTKLHYLDLAHCDLIEKEPYELILKHLTELRTLKLTSDNDILNIIVQLPKLKELEIVESRREFLTEESLKNLVTFQANQLQKLKLIVRNVSMHMAGAIAQMKKLKVFHWRCGDIKEEHLVIFSQLTELEELSLRNFNHVNDKTLLMLLKNCLKLKYLELRYCDRLSPEFIHNALDLLKDQRSRCLRTDRIKIKLTFLSYNDQLHMTKHVVEDFPDILDLSFTFSCSDVSDEDLFDEQFSENEVYYDDSSEEYDF